MQESNSAGVGPAARKSRQYKFTAQDFVKALISPKVLFTAVFSAVVVSTALLLAVVAVNGDQNNPVVRALGAYAGLLYPTEVTKYRYLNNNTTGCPTIVPQNAWRGCYYKYSGTDYFNPANFLVTRNVNQISFDWLNGSPESVVPSDYFSARWEGDFNFESGEYTFTAVKDTGMRVFLDNKLVFDRFYSEANEKFTFTSQLTSGIHRVRVEYYESTGLAAAKLSWAKTSSASGGGGTGTVPGLGLSKISGPAVVDSCNTSTITLNIITGAKDVEQVISSQNANYYAPELPRFIGAATTVTYVVDANKFKAGDNTSVTFALRDITSKSVESSIKVTRQDNCGTKGSVQLTTPTVYQCTQGKIGGTAPEGNVSDVKVIVTQGTGKVEITNIKDSNYPSILKPESNNNTGTWTRSLTTQDFNYTSGKTLTAVISLKDYLTSAVIDSKTLTIKVDTTDICNPLISSSITVGSVYAACLGGNGIKSFTDNLSVTNGSTTAAGLHIFWNGTDRGELMRVEARATEVRSRYVLGIDGKNGDKVLFTLVRDGSGDPNQRIIAMAPELTVQDNKACAPTGSILINDTALQTIDLSTCGLRGFAKTAKLTARIDTPFGEGVVVVGSGTYSPVPTEKVTDANDVTFTVDAEKMGVTSGVTFNIKSTISDNFVQGAGVVVYRSDAACGNSIDGAQGFDPNATPQYTSDIAYENTYVVLYGTFPSSGNSLVSAGSVSGTIDWQGMQPSGTYSQINIKLGPGAGTATFAVSNSRGQSNTISIPVVKR